MNNTQIKWQIEKTRNTKLIESMDLQDWEKRELLEYIEDPSNVLVEMANLRGNDIKLVTGLPFSFYISSKKAVHGLHAIRAKILWNPSRMRSDSDGNLELHGDYEYTVGSHKYKPTAKELAAARAFFKKYKVLFAAIWECVVDDIDVFEYLKGNIDLGHLLATFDLPGKNFYLVNHCTSIEELEQCVRKNKIFNMND